MEFMLDTNTCIYIIKRTPPDVIRRFKRTAISKIGISSITLSELLYGVSKSSRPEQNLMALTQFLAPLEILSYGDEAAQCYGSLRAHLEKQGTPLGSLDMLIAAHALSTNCTLITNNKREFSRIPNLKIDNWVKQRNHEFPSA
jgi:tRNA(fMet)-specific endonuclease VapC